MKIKRVEEMTPEDWANVKWDWELTPESHG